MFRIERLAVLAILLVLVIGCSQSSRPNRSDPPLSSIRVLLPETDIAALGTVGAVSDSFKITDIDPPVQIYEVQFDVERTLFGDKLTSLTVRVPFYYLDSDGDAFSSTKIPNLRAGERTLLFLTGSSPYADPDIDVYVTAGGGVVPGKFTVRGSSVQSVFMDERETTIDAVALWLSGG